MAEKYHLLMALKDGLTLLKDGLTLVLSLCALVVSIYLLRDTQVYQRPPSLLATNVTIYQHGDAALAAPAIKPGVELDGGLWIVNNGRDVALIKSISCYASWQSKVLPMRRPYDALPMEKRLAATKPSISTVLVRGNCVGRMPGSLASGEYVGWTFDRIETPSDYAKKDFYVMGYVEYFGGLGVRHLLLFARRYDAGNQMFVPVKDHPDYEFVE